MSRLFAVAVYLLSALIGVAAFLYPFLLPQIQATTPAGAEGLSAIHPGVLTMALISLCLVAVLVEMQGEAVSAKTVAALGVMVAIASVLRFVETAVPGPGGFSPLFVPILLAGYVFGARFGYLAGVLALLVSALVTGGVGPWLPYQMYVAGWLGATAGWLPHPRHRRAELVLLVGVAGLWGFLYGFLTNLYFWPFIAGEGLAHVATWDGWRTTLGGYALFYGATSLIWDLFRMAGNVLLMLAFGLPAVKALTRFRDRFDFSTTPVVAAE